MMKVFRIQALFAGVMSVIFMAANVPAQAGDDQVTDRSQIPAKHKWQLEHMYKTQKDWEKHYAELDKLIDEVAGLEGTAGKSADSLLNLLKKSDQLGIQIEKLYSYASHGFDQDMRETEWQKLKDRAVTLYVKAGEKTSWMSPELTNLPEETVKSWMKQNEELAVYDHYFDNLWRMKKYILSPREEELLAMSSKATGASDETFGLLTNTEIDFGTMKDEDGKEIEINSPVYYDKIYSKDRRVREEVYKKFHEGFMKHKSTLASTLQGAIDGDWYRAKARGYNSSLEAALNREKLPTSVYTGLIDTINEHLPLLHRYTALRKRVLKLDEVHPYDLYVNLVTLPESEEKIYEYEEAVELILKNLEPMGEEYVNAMRHGFESGWVDVVANKGKRSGAYSGGCYLVHPYVLLNYKGTYNGVSTVAHEMGHSMQSYFANTTQPPVYSDYPMFTAEVASTSAEIIFKQQILNQTTDPRQKAAMLDRMLDDIRQTVFRQTRFAEFDLFIHELAEKGQPMTADVLLAKNKEIFQKYYGPELVIDEVGTVECLRIPHHYYNYYVYRYADSYSAAATIAKKIMAGEPNAVENWMKFLKTGHSMYAIDMLKIAGADMTTSKPVEDCMAMFEDLLNQLETLLEEMGEI